MTKTYKIGLCIGLSTIVALLAFILLNGSHFAVLNPKGSIADQQRDLIVIATLLMLLVVVPVFVLTFAIAWKYPEGNKKATYRPDEDGNRAIETIWWTIPLALIIVLSGIIWRTSHTLDPYQPIASDRKPIRVQVVALEWKWLFIYPDLGVASVNYLQIPEDTPINFQLTADAPMNSFWIPQLGGQVYTMAGMETKLHLIANEQGEYTGQSANLSGEGFADMKFTTKATSFNDFNGWVQATRQSTDKLDRTTYGELAKKSHDNKVQLFAYDDRSVYGGVLGKYMAPAGSGGHHGN